jgi:hypothetical protein
VPECAYSPGAGKEKGRRVGEIVLDKSVGEMTMTLREISTMGREEGNLVG